MKTIYMLIIAMTLAVGAVSLAECVERDLKNDIVRLHIVADSDEKQAQELKLKVRDEIIKNVSLSDRDFVIKAENEAKKVLKENNENYGVKATFERFYFPVKKYKNVTLPSGEYNSVRLVLGRGAGKNWWCIMYPPMCAVNDEEMELIEGSDKLLKNDLNSESYELVTSESDKVKLKFKTVEIIQYIKNMRKKLYIKPTTLMMCPLSSRQTKKQKVFLSSLNIQGGNFLCCISLMIFHRCHTV